MKKIELHLGGHPLKTENFSHVMEGVVESFEGVVEAFNRGLYNGLVISGCDLTTFTSSDAVWTDGFVYLDGEICRVEAGSATKTSGVFKWEKYTIALPIDPQAYADATTHDVHLESMGRIVGGPSVPATDVLASKTSTPNMIETVQPEIRDLFMLAGSFTAKDDSDNPVTFTTAGTSDRLIRYKRTVNNNMFMNLNFRGTLSAVADKLFVRIPDPFNTTSSLTADGDCHSVAFVNDVPCLLTAENGSALLKIASGSSYTFPSGTLLHVRGQIHFKVL